MRQVRNQSIPRDFRNKAMANILIDKELLSDFFLWRELHPKVKSLFRSASLYLFNKKLRFYVPSRFLDVKLEDLERIWLDA